MKSKHVLRPAEEVGRGAKIAVDEGGAVVDEEEVRT